MKKLFETTFLIKIKGEVEHNGIIMTGQMMRDKILTPLQEMWLLGRIKSFTLEEIDSRSEKKWVRKNTKTIRKPK